MQQRPTMVLAAAALLSLATAGLAQPPSGVTPAMIATALPEEGAPVAEPGPYAVTSAAAFGAPGLLVFRPATLTAFPARDSLPVVVWGNGGCSMDTTRYNAFLTTIASHGFLVIGTAVQEGVPRRQANVEDLRSALDWTERENARTGSPLAGKIAVSRVAAMGQSCGGSLALALAADPRVTTVAVLNAGVAADGANTLAALHGPALLVNGHERDFAMAASRAAFDAIQNVPAFYAARHGAGHTGTMFHRGGGELANVASSWLRWQLKDDEEAAALFVGAACGLCADPNWEVAARLAEN